MITCTITTDEDISTIRALFATELARQHPRSSVDLDESGGNAVFRITGQDVTAMRAALNGITSILSVHEKTRNAHG